MSNAEYEFPSSEAQARIDARSKQSQGWSVDTFAAFWAKPVATPERIPPILARNIVGYWPGREEPIRGAAAYWQYIVDFVALVPDLHARVMEHAMNGEFTFIRWEMTATGPDGPIACTGCDRTQVRDGIVLENRIFCEHSIFRVLAARAAR
jgi:hypothetical protein